MWSALHQAPRTNSLASQHYTMAAKQPRIMETNAEAQHTMRCGGERARAGAAGHCFCPATLGAVLRSNVNTLALILTSLAVTLAFVGGLVAGLAVCVFRPLLEL
ncbi:hypothetical protein WJX81_000376 [Elliptochloris bilobata]|uniref:Uncharacterized protein n=1 Tax=Elliptochloris bilobata TaxID=381761 RepID=A0AAW1RKK9_9CHLO